MLSSHRRLLAVLTIIAVASCSNGEKFFKGRLFFKHGERSDHFYQSDHDDVKTYWFNQTLDHGNPSDTRQWKQRYFVNDTFYKPGGPVFLQIVGEGEANPIWMNNGAWIDYAQKLGAYCIQLEHRFYGKSHPLPDLSVKNLMYLTSEQALGDLASFVATMKATHFTDNKWVAFGGSYPGSLAAWFRLKYPHLVDIAVSSSAPLVAQLDFKEYLGVVDAAINRSDSTCHSQIRSAVTSIEQLLKRRVGWQLIRRTFNLCDEFSGNSKNDVANLFETLAGNFMDIVQYNKDNRAFEGSSTANISIDTLCNIMTTKETNLTPLERYAQVNALLLNATKQNCSDIKYSKMIKNLQDPSWNSSVAGGERQWLFQTCTEFGFYQTSDLNGEPFGSYFPLDFSVRQCADIYGSKFNKDFILKGIFRTNSVYGEKKLRVSKVIFVNGSIDPWHALGIIQQSETTDDNLVIYIDGTAHCANMYPSSPNDSKELMQAREVVLQQISTWLQG